MTSVLLSKSKSDSLHPTKRYTHTLPLFQLSITTSFLFLFSFTLNYNSEMLAFYKLGVKMFLILEGISYFSSLSAYADRALAFPHSPFQTVIH